jgi:hypothetical protein
LWSRVVGVAQPASDTAAAKSGPWLRIASKIAPASDRTPFVARLEVGVGQPVSAAAPGNFKYPGRVPSSRAGP